jgi:hypothetical protein
LTVTRDVDKLLDALLEARRGMDDGDRAPAVTVYRRLALGEPVTEIDLATATGQDLQHVHDRLGAWPGVHRDEQQQAIGFWGLTVADMPRTATGPVAQTSACGAPSIRCSSRRSSARPPR